MRYLILACSLVAVILSSPMPASGQPASAANKEKPVIALMEDSLVVLADSMLNTAIPPDRMDIAFRFARMLKAALELPGSYDYPFSRLGSIIHILKPEDNRFRIFNWLVAPNRVIRRYYGVIQMETGELFPLINYAGRLSEREVVTKVMDPKHWYGCAYYDILEKKENDRVYYFLFGINTDGTYSNKKLIDVLVFSEHGPVFGAPVFLVPQEDSPAPLVQTRFLLQYSQEASCSLHYDKDRKMILFDRLRSKIYDPARKGTYAPTGQVDGFNWEDGKWVFVREAIPILHLKDGQAPVDGVFQK